jgi:hypothetical protein
MSNGDVTPPHWQDWAPPLNPPVADGVPIDVAQGLADLYWEDEPHLCAALQWEYYAAMQDPSPAVSSVSTGVQSIAYSPPAPSGTYGTAIARAQWHRSFITGHLETVPLISSIPEYELMPPLRDMRWWVEGHLPR